MTLDHWLYWVAAFLIVVAILMVFTAIQEWWEWYRQP